jgi:hypothetical protein
MSEDEETGVKHGCGLWLGCAVALVLAAGALFSWQTARRADRDLRAGMLRQMGLMARDVSIADIQALSGTEADLASPGYFRLKEQFISVGAATPKCRFLYLVGKKPDGALFFYLDSEPADSQAYSPPGQLYEEASAGFRRAVYTGTQAVEGPVTDRWGVWVSGLVPLVSPQTGAMAAVLGMDIDAHVWKWMLVRAALPPALLTLALAVLLLFSRRVACWCYRAQPVWLQRLEAGLAAGAGWLAGLPAKLLAACAAGLWERREKNP